VKQGLLVAAALLIGAFLANVLLDDSGYVALRFGERLIEMSAVTFVLLAIAAYFAVRLIIRLIKARVLWRESQEERRRERARRALARGLLELSEGDWEAAENTLTRSAREAEVPAAHYLVAARAAELQGLPQRRDELLAKALELSGDRPTPALIMQAEIHLKHKQVQAALKALEQIEASGAQNARGLLLMARAFRQTGDWQRLQSLEPRLRATRGISTSVADETVTQIYLDRLKAAGNAEDPTLLKSAWKETPKSLSQRADVVVAYARAAMACDEPEAAEEELRALIEREWDEQAVLTYGEIETDEPLVMLERAERWLPAHQEDAALLYTCSRLCMRAELYGKARSYLESSIAIRPRLEAYQLLAALMEQLGDRERAWKALSDAMVLAVGKKTVMPKIRARRWSSERRQNDRRRT
jgi:HemY protein